MKQLYGLGLFVRKDKNQKDIKVGDFVTVTREGFTLEDYDFGVDRVILDRSWTGQVRLDSREEAESVLLSKQGWRNNNPNFPEFSAWIVIKKI